MNKKVHIKMQRQKNKILFCFFSFLFLFFYGNNQAVFAVNTHKQSVETLIQQKRITLNFNNKSIKLILSEIEKITGIGYVIKEEADIESLINLSVNVKNVTIEEALNIIFANTDCTYRIDGDVITVIPKTKISKNKDQKVLMKGKVIEKDTKKPIAGATIIIKGSSNGAISDAKGEFILNAKVGEEYEVLFTGMKYYKGLVNNDSIQKIIALTEDIMEVDDVIVTGYFTRRKDSYTGAASTISGEQLRQVSGQNVLNALAMIDPSFEFIESLDMGSDPNNLPLFQVRGSTNLESDYKNNPNMPTFILDGFEVTAQKIFDLDPNKIASATILKDAAATAIYGSRASNGVVVVETIIPKEGKINISYNLGLNFEVTDISSYNLMNSAEKLLYELQADVYKGYTLMDADRLKDSYNARLAQINAGIDTDWLSIPINKVGFGHKHTLMLEGGTESLRYGLDVTASDKNGVMKKSGRENYGIGMKLQYVYKRVKFMNYLTFDTVKERNSPYGNFSEYASANPYFYPYDKNGEVTRLMGSVIDHSFNQFGQVISLYSNMSETNPLYNANIGVRNGAQHKNFVNNFSFEWNVTDALRLKTQLSLNNRDYESDRYLPATHTSFEGAEVKGSYTKGITKDFTYDANAILSYFKTIHKHSINATAIYNIKQSKTDGFTMSSVNFPNAQMDHVGMATAYPEGSRPQGIYEMSRLMGIALNVNYGYDNKYLLDASVRSDASSVFGSNKRWGTFGSVGIGWNIHNERFMKVNKLFTVLKVRGSWGLTGGTNFYPFQAMNIYEYDKSIIQGISYGGSTGALIKAYGNANLKWQRTEKKNIGLDFELLGRRLSGYLNVYSDLSKDVLIDVSLAPSIGFSSYKENLGKVKNYGYELNLKGSVIQNPKNGIKWDLFFNAVRNKNKLIEINDALVAFNDKQDGSKSDIENENRTKPVVRYRQGESINTIWANESLGIDPCTGKEVFLDANAEKVFAWNVNNYKPLGNTDPDIRGNFGTNFMYKGFTISAYFMYNYGGDVYNQTLVSKVENVDPKKNADRRVLYDRWKNTGDLSQFKSIKDKTTTMPTSRFIEKNNFIQSSSMNLSYEFSREMIQKIGFQKLKVSIMGNNLFRWSTVKMERGIIYPFARTFTATIQASF